MSAGRLAAPILMACFLMEASRTEDGGCRVSDWSSLGPAVSSNDTAGHGGVLASQLASCNKPPHTPPQGGSRRDVGTTMVELMSGGPPGASEAEKERFWTLENRRLKSALVTTLERSQLMLKQNAEMRRYTERLLELRTTSDSPREHPEDPQRSPAKQKTPPNNIQDLGLYQRYGMLVKQNCALEEEIRKLKGRATLMPSKPEVEKEFENYKEMARMQMEAHMEDWRQERSEKERVMAENQLLRQELSRLRLQQQQQQQPRSCQSAASSRDLMHFPSHSSVESFEELHPVSVSPLEPRLSPGLVTSPLRRQPLPPPGFALSVERKSGSLPSVRVPARSRGVVSRSVEEVLADRYDSLPPPPSPPPPGPGRAGPQPDVAAARPGRPGRDSGYDEEASLWQDCRSQPGDEWELAAGSGRFSRTDAVWCSHCRRSIPFTSHLLYLDHLNSCHGPAGPDSWDSG